MPGSFTKYHLLHSSRTCLLQILKEQQAARAERERLRIRMLTADPMDIEAQRLIAQVQTCRILLSTIDS